MIEWKNASVTFTQKQLITHAVKDVNLKIDSGQIYGIVGGSGAGKSTLLRTINGLQCLSSGEVLVEGKSVSSLKGRELRELRQNIGMHFQHFNLAGSKTVYQNIAFMLETTGHKDVEIRERVDELLDFVNISEKKNVYPGQLSGGQKQRVAIARALANNSKILLCDEPTSALDTETTASVLELIRRINRSLGVTIVIITHELDVVKEICDEVAVMDKGSVVETGEVYSIFTSPKNEFTRQLVARTQDSVLPKGILDHCKKDIYRITYLGDGAIEPILSETSRKYGVNYNILKGKIEYISQKPFGILDICIEGDNESVTSALAELSSRTAGIERIYKTDVSIA